MNVFEKFITSDIDTLVMWFDKYSQVNDSHWMNWWDENYCDKCESIVLPTEEYRSIFGCSSYADTMTCGYCELKGKCKFFPDLDAVPDNKDIIKMWLESEVKE